MVDLEKSWIVGGTEAPPVNVADLPVRFTSTESMTDWETGQRDKFLDPGRIAALSCCTTSSSAPR